MLSKDAHRNGVVIHNFEGGCIATTTSRWIAHLNIERPDAQLNPWSLSREIWTSSYRVLRPAREPVSKRVEFALANSQSWAGPLRLVSR